MVFFFFDKSIDYGFQTYQTPKIVEKIIHQNKQSEYCSCNYTHEQVHVCVHAWVGFGGWDQLLVGFMA